MTDFVYSAESSIVAISENEGLHLDGITVTDFGLYHHVDGNGHVFLSRPSLDDSEAVFDCVIGVIARLYQLQEGIPRLSRLIDEEYARIRQSLIDKYAHEEEAVAIDDDAVPES